MSEERGPHTGLVIIAVIMTVLFFCGAVLPRDPDLDRFFGVEAWRTPGPGVLLLACGLLLALLLAPGWAEGLARGLGGLVRLVPRLLRLPLLLVAAGTAFWVFRSHKLSGDAQMVTLMTIDGSVFASNPLTNFLYIGVSRALSWPAVLSIRLVACASGVLYVHAAVRIARECLPAGPARSALAVLLLTCGTAALFFGSIEVYAPLAAMLAVYLLLGIRATRNDGAIFWPAVALGTAFGLHGSAGLLLPSLGYLANGCRWWPLRPGRLIRAGLAFLLPVVLVYASLFFLTWGGAFPEDDRARVGSFLGGDLKGPFLPLRLTATNVLHRYAILDADHLIGVLNLMALAAPVGFALLLTGRWPARRMPAFRFAAVAAVFLVIFPVFWNVGFCHRMDWDLFSLMGIPVALLGGLAFLDRSGGARRAVGAAALSIFCFVPFVHSNQGDTGDRRLFATNLYWSMQQIERSPPDGLAGRREIARREMEKYARLMARYDPHHVEDETQRAQRLARSGQYGMAEVLFRQVLSNDPGNPPASEGLGAVLIAQNEPEEARTHLLNALREWEWSLGARIDLARIALARGDPDEAIRQLENGLRRGALHQRAGEALILLAELRDRRGDAEVARALHDLARERGVTRSGDASGHPPRRR